MSIRRLSGILVLTFALVPIMRASAAAQAPGSDVLTAEEVRALSASAATPNDHRQLSRHFAALAAHHEAGASEHRSLAQERRVEPNPSESKRPGAPDTALHCVRLADRGRRAANDARELSARHEQMAATAR